MSNFDETVIRRLTALEREVERLRVKERPVGGGGVTDHGALTGLSDNDHPQYLLTTGKAADSDKLDGVDSTGFATAEHNHDAAYLGISAKASDSDKLDGVDSAGYVNTANAQTIGGVKTFTSIPILPSSDPTSDNQAVRKGYADTAYLLNSGWQSYTPTWTASTTNPSIGNGTLSGRYFQIGKLVYCQFRMVAGSTTTFGSGDWRFSYPVAPNIDNATNYQVGSVFGRDSGAAFYVGITQYSGKTYMSLIINNNWVSATAPFTWANGDYLEVNVIYEVE